MRGLVHYLSGLAVAALFASLARDAIHGSLAILIPAIYGYLPDFVDFKFLKYAESWDYEVKPNWKDADPQEMAEIIARAIDDSYERGRVSLKLHSSRAPGDLYRKYEVIFNSDKREVIVELGPLVTLGGAPIRGTEPKKRRGAAKTRSKFVKIYPKPTIITGFGGSSFAFTREGETVKLSFLPWHHTWTHSFAAGFLFASPLVLLLLLAGYSYPIDVFLASMFGYWLHVIEDQFGVMGSSIFWPLSKKRIPGLKIGESGSFEINLATAYASIMAVIWGFNSVLDVPAFRIDASIYIMVTLVPVLVLYAISFKKIRKELASFGPELLYEREEMEEAGELRVE